MFDMKISGDKSKKVTVNYNRKSSSSSLKASASQQANFNEVSKIEWQSTLRYWLIKREVQATLDRWLHIVTKEETIHAA
jgi:hypothetical protein